MTTVQQQLLHPLQTYLPLASSLSGPASASNFILQIINNPQIFVFGEILNIPQVKELDENDKNKKLLKLFAYGNYWDLKDSMEEYELSENNILKLKKLSLVTLAQQCRVLEYDTLMQRLDIDNVRELEDILIDTTYTGLLKGKLDQKLKCFQVYEFCGRDVEPNELEDIARALDNWSQHCDTILNKLGELSKVADLKFKNHEKYRTQHQKTIKQLEENLREAAESMDLSLLGAPRQSNQ